MKDAGGKGNSRARTFSAQVSDVTVLRRFRLLLPLQCNNSESMKKTLSRLSLSPQIADESEGRPEKKWAELPILLAALSLFHPQYPAGSQRIETILIQRNCTQVSPSPSLQHLNPSKKAPTSTTQSPTADRSRSRRAALQRLSGELGEEDTEPLLNLQRRMRRIEGQSWKGWSGRRRRGGKKRGGWREKEERWDGR